MRTNGTRQPGDGIGLFPETKPAPRIYGQDRDLFGPGACFPARSDFFRRLFSPYIQQTKRWALGWIDRKLRNARIFGSNRSDALYQGTASAVPQWLGLMRALAPGLRFPFLKGTGFSPYTKETKRWAFSPWVTLFCHSSRAQSWKRQQKAVPRRLKPRIAEKFTAPLKPCPSFSDFSSAALSR